MDTKQLLFELSETQGVSGYESLVGKIAEREFKKYCDEVYTDALGNVVGVRKGKGKGKVLLAAHMDEIGLMVKKLEEGGFIRFETIGGFDQRALVSQEVTIHTKNHGGILGVIGVKPPHITSAEEAGKAYKAADMAIDTGYSLEKLKEIVCVGDIITIKRTAMELQNGMLTGKAMDDRAGLVSIIMCLENLKNYDCDADLYCVGSVQEEVGCRGGRVVASAIDPDIAIAVDVGFGQTPELSEDKSIKMGKGPSIGIGPNIHPRVYEQLKKTAKDNYIPYQVEVLPFMSGTDAVTMQVANLGTCTGVISIPLKYMHTSVETIDPKDITAAGKLLSSFVISLNNRDLEEILCY